jgi:hypothetical protein
VTPAAAQREMNFFALNTIALVIAFMAAVLLVAQDEELKRLMKESESRSPFVGQFRDEPGLICVLFKRDNRMNESATAKTLLEDIVPSLVKTTQSKIELHVRDGLTTDALGLGSAWGAKPSWVFAHVAFVPSSRSANLEQLAQTVTHALAPLRDGVEMHVYQVSRRLHTEYGEYNGEAKSGWNPARQMDWPRGSRSPFIVTLAAFPKPERFASLSTTEWAEQIWFPRQSPMSEMMQPRARYVRNIVLKPLSPSPLPAYAGIVMESWPSAKHMSPFYFFNAQNPFSLLVNTIVMMRSVQVFTSILDVETVELGEYLF